ncbi:MAG: hypothetical protein ACE5G3_02955, partial [Gammaproteobacteria bacterium]
VEPSIVAAYSVFTSIALAFATAYLLLSRLVVAANGLMRRFRPARPSSCRPGEVIHQALKITGRRSDQFRTAAVVFGVAMLILTVFGRRDWWPAAPSWVFLLIAAAATILQAVVLAKIMQLTRYRLRLSRLLEKHFEMAQRLAEAQLRGNRVYHSVPIGDAIVDNVVVGPNGVYSVHLLPPPLSSSESVSLCGGDLVFQPGEVRHELRRYRKTVEALATELGEGIGSNVVVLPVIVVPDCTIGSTAETLPMLVGLETCTSFVGWKDPRAFLMTEELEAINRWLAKKVLDTRTDSMREVIGYLDQQVPRPALV